MEEFNIIIEKGEDGYLLSEVLELPGCRSQAKTKGELLKRTKEAIELYLEVENSKISELKHSQFVGMEKLSI